MEKRNSRYYLYMAVFVAVLLLAALGLWQRAGAQDGCTVRVESGRLVVAGCVVVTATPAEAAAEAEAVAVAVVGD